MLSTLCLDAHPSFLGIFDLSIVPDFFYFAYMPILIVSLFFGLWFLIKSHNSLGIVLGLLSFVFSLSILFEAIQWIAAPASIVLFSWQVSALFQSFIAYLIVNFTKLFLKIEDKDDKIKNILLLFLLPIPIFMGTDISTPTFNLQTCEAENGFLWIYIHIYQIILYIYALLLSLRVSYKSINPALKNKAYLLFLGLLSFSISQTFIYSIGDILNDYSLYLFLPIGTLVFVIILFILIIRYGEFNTKLLGGQAFVLSIGFILFSLFFIRTIENIRIILIPVIISFIMLGYLLVKNIKNIEEEKVKALSLNTKLKKLNAKLKRSNELRAKFLSIASHQFRSPVTAIKGYTELMLDGTYGSLNSEIKEPIKRLFVSSSNLALIVNDFLNLSRIDSDSLEYNMELHNLKDIVDTAVTEQQSIIKMREDIKLIYDKGASRDNFNTVFDVGMVKQVITNLIDNAIKYTVAGEVRVTLEKDDEKNVIRFKVKDSGIGIPADSIDNLFSQFTRASNANKVNVMGTGLGLYIAKEIIKAHNGAIWAESEGDDKGSTFIVELPIVTQVQDSDSGQV